MITIMKKKKEEEEENEEVFFCNDRIWEKYLRNSQVSDFGVWMDRCVT